MSKAKAIPDTFKPGTIVHDSYHESWMVVATEWDPMSGAEVCRIVHLLGPGGTGFLNDDGTLVSAPPFSGLIGRVYPKTAAYFHEPEVKVAV